MFKNKIFCSFNIFYPPLSFLVDDYVLLLERRGEEVQGEPLHEDVPALQPHRQQRLPGLHHHTGQHMTAQILYSTGQFRKCLEHVILR